MEKTDSGKQKKRKYEELRRQMEAALEERDPAFSSLSNAAAILYQGLERVNWAGFYLLDAGALWLGPFQGKPACVRIEVGKGVCGTAAAERRTVLVEDVHRFPGHIACDCASRSEIVVPLYREGDMIAVMDIDSPEEGRFDRTTRRGWSESPPLSSARWRPYGPKRAGERSDEEEHERSHPHVLSWLDATYGTQKEGFFTNSPGSCWRPSCSAPRARTSRWRRCFRPCFPVSLRRSGGEGGCGRHRSLHPFVGLYQTKARNLKKCCGQIVEEFGGEVPKDLDGLLKLAGVGRKTGTLFLADAYGIEGVTVDTHVFRISHRLGWVKGKNPVQVEQELMKALPKDHWNRINFQLIYHGRAVCRARKADCASCGLIRWCEQGRREGGCNRTGAMV